MNTDYNAASAHAHYAPWFDWALPVALASIGFIIIHRFDLELFELARRLERALPSDLRREWFAWQQYGQGVAIIFTALLIWTLSPIHRRRLLDLALALAIAQLCSTAGKMLIARPRPRESLMDPHSFPGPWGVYPVEVKGSGQSVWRLAHGWDRASGSSDLWSMPSSHALFAAMLSAFVATLWPRAAWPLIIAATVVALGRVVFGAHWPSDVVVGSMLGLAIGLTITRRGLGVRLFDWFWIRFIDRAAQPAWARIRSDHNA